MLTTISSFASLTRKAKKFGLAFAALAAFSSTSLYAQTIALVSANPVAATPGTAISVSASGFVVNQATGNVTVTLTPQFVGPTLTATGVAPGLGSGRQINYTQPNGAAGLYTVSISGSGVTSSNTLTVSILGPPSFTVNPVTGARGTTVQVTITGVNTTFDASTLASFGPGISVGGAAENSLGPVAVQPNGTAIATLTINSAATPGSRSVRVLGQDDVTLANAFTVIHPPLTLVTINPTSGPAGSPVSIAASGFIVNDVPTLTVTLTPSGGGSPISVSGSAPGTLTNRQVNFTVPVGTAPGVYTATVAGSGYVSANSLQFTVTPSPSFTLNPASGATGSTVQVTITGANTTFPGDTTANFGPGISVGGAAEGAYGPVAVQPNGTAIATLTINAGAVLGARTVQVLGSDAISRANAFTVTAAPSIISVNPDAGQQGQTLAVTITGANTQFTGLTTVSFGAGITVNSATRNSDTSLTANISVAPAATVGVRTVTVTTGAQTLSLLNGFAVTGSTMVCSATAGVPPIVRAEGLTELSSDIVLSCQGGNAGQTTSVSVSVFLSAPVTSRIVGGQSEALLIVDETNASGNTFRGTQTALSTLQWTNIPVVAPGQAATRVLRITNIRFNGTTVPQGTLIPPQVFASVSGSPGVQNQQMVVAFVLPGLEFSVINCNGSSTASSAFSQCASQNSAADRNLISGTSGDIQFGVRFREATAAAFKPRLAAGQEQSVPGFLYGTESGILRTSDQPYSIGGADSGTRLVARFTNIPAGVRLFVTTRPSFGSTAGTDAVLVQTDANGAGGTQPGTPVTIPGTVTLFCPQAGGGGVAGAEIAVTNNSATAVWEVTAANTVSLDSLVFGVAVAYAPNTSQNLPTLGQASVSGNFAPFYGDASAGQSSSTLPIPRFADRPIVANAFTISACGTPRILSIVPGSVNRGQTTTVIITGESTNFQQGITQVSLGSGLTIGSVTVTSATTLTAVVTAASDAATGLRTLTVTTGTQVVTLPDAFSVSAAASNQLLTCTTNTGVPPLLRAEGFTELTGDILISCTGGSAGETSNINIQLFLNVPITSRLVGNQSEALLLVDELGVGVGLGATPALYRATAGAGENSLVWANVVFQAPGAGNQRIIRITNVRANVTTLAASASLVPSQVFAFISVSPSQSLPLGQAQQTIGFVLPGLSFGVTNCNGSGSASAAFAECVAENSSGNADLISGTTGNMQFGLRFTEGFPTAFKTQLAPNQNPSTPGVAYNTESGFLRTQEYPYSVGGADTGTRLVARFNNVPNGVRLFVTTRPSFGSTAGLNAILVQTGPNAAGGTSSQAGLPVGIAGTATLMCPLTSGEPVSAAEIPVVNNSAMAVWEVTSANSGVLESAVFGVAVAYAPDTPNQRPGLGEASVSGNFGPFYAATSDAGRMSSSLPIPRFIDAPVNAAAFRIDSCRTNLLFPFVTNQAGFDTGIAVSNTSSDPFGSPQRQQAGACTVNYYGSVPGGAAPPPQRTTPVASGSHMAFVLSSGGSHAIAGTPGFQGYLVVQCDFRYGHGFAFITDGPVGAARVAEGYLGLVMDSATSSRGSESETLNH